MTHRVTWTAVALLGLVLSGGLAGFVEAWEPTKPVEFVVGASKSTLLPR